MRVGLTYDLRDDYLAAGYGEEETAEFDRADTVTALEATLGSSGHETVRVGGIRELVRRLGAGERWDMVFNIAEGLSGFGREAQVPALLEAYGIPYTFSDPLVLCLTLHKGMAKRVVRDLGLPTPDFGLIEDPGDLEKLDLPFPLFAKPVAGGTGVGVGPSSLAGTMAELRSVADDLLGRFRQPVIVETYLPGREFTVGILGTGSLARSVGIMEVVLKPDAEAGSYTYVNKERCEDLVEYRLPDDEEAREAARVALAAWRGLGCRDAGRVDLRSDGHGRPHFLEVNPLAGLHPEHSDLPIMWKLAGRAYPELIGAIMESARERVFPVALCAPHLP